MRIFRVRTVFMFCKALVIQLQGPKNLNLFASTRRITTVNSKQSLLWTAERGLAVGLLGIIPTAFIYPSHSLEALMAFTVVMHQHWGLEAIVTDYIRPVIFGNVAPRLAHGALLAYSVLTLAGIMYFGYTDVGIAKSVKKIWSLRGQ